MSVLEVAWQDSGGSASGRLTGCLFILFSTKACSSRVCNLTLLLSAVVNGKKIHLPNCKLSPHKCGQSNNDENKVCEKLYFKQM